MSSAAAEDGRISAALVREGRRMKRRVQGLRRDDAGFELHKRASFADTQWSIGLALKQVLMLEANQQLDYGSDERDGVCRKVLLSWVFRKFSNSTRFKDRDAFQGQGKSTQGSRS